MDPATQQTPTRSLSRLQVGGGLFFVSAAGLSIVADRSGSFFFRSRAVELGGVRESCGTIAQCVLRSRAVVTRGVGESRSMVVP